MFNYFSKSNFYKNIRIKELVAVYILINVLLITANKDYLSFRPMPKPNIAAAKAK